MPPTPAADHYAVLGVAESATFQAVREAYRTIIRQTHPDVAGDDPTATERAVAANAAWAILKDPSRRAAYDRQRATARRPSVAVVPVGDQVPSWGPGGIRPVTVAQLREAAARESAYSAIGRAQREAFSRASWRLGVSIMLLGALVLVLAVAASS